MRSRLLIPGFLALLAACKDKAPSASAAPPVRVAQAVERDVPRVLEATGTVEPVRTARVEAQVSGLIDKVMFREGDQVAQGQVLFQIDPRPFRAPLSQADRLTNFTKSSFASASVSLLPTSNHVPGTCHVCTGVCW